MSTQRSNDGLLRLVLIVLAAIVLFPVAMMLVAMPFMGIVGMWGVGGMGALGLAMMGLWLLVLVGIGYVVVRAVRGSDAVDEPTDDALEELRLAYARGELSTEEFDERRERLERRGIDDERERP